MTESMPEMMAVCGLDCGSCTIRRMPFDQEAAKGVIGWFRSMGWLKGNEGAAEALERNMYCKGCHGDREVHWSADCWILKCAVDERGFRHCHECAEFPCQRPDMWGAENDKYAAALGRLKLLHLARGSKEA